MGLLFGIFGLVFAFFAVVALVVGAHLAWIYGHLTVALACWIYAGATSLTELRELLSRDSSRRTARYGGNAVIQTAAFAVILGLVAWLSVRNPVHWDWTEAGVHSLSQGTIDVLAQIEPDPGIQIIGFFAPGRELEAKDILDQYTYATDAIDVSFVDGNARPDLATRYEVRSHGVILVCAGPCESATGIARVSEVSEQEFTRAIRSVISDRRKVYFLTGHGEASLDGGEASDASVARTALEGENLEVTTLLLAREEGIPEDAAAVVVFGPTSSLFDRELEMLDAYLKQGGAILLLSDPMVVTGIEEQVSAWGVDLGSDVIIDQQVQLFGGAQLGVDPIVVSYGSHESTRKLDGRLTLFHLARSVTPATGASDTAEIALTGPGSWAEKDVDRFVNESRVGIDPDDQPGPIAIAVARTFPANGDGPGGRLVVFGDSDFARNRYIREGSNADLLLNVVNWLIGEESFITIERKMPRPSRVVMTTEQFFNFRYLSLFVVPEAILLAGIVIWWRRRT